MKKIYKVEKMAEEYPIIIKGDLGEAQVMVRHGDKAEDVIRRYFKAFGDTPANIADWRLEHENKVYRYNEPVFDRIPPNAVVNLLSERVVG